MIQNNKIFNKLKENVGKEIICTYYRYGNIYTHIFVLKNVVEYEYIEISATNDNPKVMHLEFMKSLSFITFGQFIISIKDEFGNEIYMNNNPVSLLKDVSNIDELVVREKLTFGSDYISVNEMNSTTYLINEGCKQIDQSLHQEWTIFVENNVIFELNVIKATISMLKKINSGKSFYDAEIEVYSDEFNLFGTDTEKVDRAVLTFCKNSKEYREYLKKIRNNTYFSKVKGKGTGKK